MLCAHGRAGQTQLFYWRRISQSEIRNSAAAESEGGQKFLPPNPLPFCPPERSVWRAKRAVSSIQKRFGFRQTNAQRQNVSARASLGIESIGGVIFSRQCVRLCRAFRKFLKHQRKTSLAPRFSRFLLIHKGG